MFQLCSLTQDDWRGPYLHIDLPRRYPGSGVPSLVYVEVLGVDVISASVWHADVYTHWHKHKDTERKTHTVTNKHFRTEDDVILCLCQTPPTGNRASDVFSGSEDLISSPTFSKSWTLRHCELFENSFSCLRLWFFYFLFPVYFSVNCMSHPVSVLHPVSCLPPVNFLYTFSFMFPL